ncbi:RNA polymerase sigma factor [Gordonibacter massiliensis]|nr:RNA polymerase sigma factor [Gordonibacter massiliensis (ex Traore et al. 2017)]
MRRWGDMVLRLALSQLRDASDAEDVFQDVFIRLLKDRTTFNDDEHLKAWLLRVTVNRCRDIGRSGWKRRNEPLAERHTAIEAPNLLGSEVWDAIGALPPDLRAVVHLHYVEGYSTDEVAGLVGCRPSTARTRLHRARKHMRAALETGELAGRSARSAAADDQPASPRSATNETTPSGKEADHEQRSLQRLRYEDAGGESVRPPA